MLSIENLSKSFGDKTLFNSITCHIIGGERIGLIGVNGTGKSTLLKIIARIEPADHEEIHHANDYRIQYLAQAPTLDPNLTVMEQIYYGNSAIMKVMREYEQALLQLQRDSESEKAQTNLLAAQQKMDELGAWEANTTAKTILTKLGITDFDKPTATLSGGQKKRVALATALIQPADLLILDEPTNHLDHATIEWLEKYLQTYPGSLLLVTHDRYFLNRVTNRIFELDRGNLYTYEGNYEVFLEKKAEREALERSEEVKHQNTLRRELAWLKSGVKARSTKQKARIERVHTMQQKTFDTRQENVEVPIGSARLGKKVIELKQVCKSFGNKEILSNVNQLLTPGDRVGIVGPNGSGKSTFLHIMAQRLSPDDGEVIVGDTVKIGYYTQGEEELDGDLRIIDYIKEIAEVIHTKDGSVITAEQMLEHFLFSRKQQWTYIRKLSGGEKRRLYLLKVLMQEPNVLFLDEPTNDLDTQTLSVLEEYLDHFPGVVVTVSHDRYFLDRVVDRLLVFDGKGNITSYHSNYSDFLAHQESTHIAAKSAEKSKNQRQSPKPQKKKLSYLEKKEWDEIEDVITSLEEKLESIKNDIVAAGSDSQKVQELYAEQMNVEKALNEKMDRWEELSLLIEE
ncbi:ABC-F family ATP-binding cassette domain-containing protein [Virgibacillus pantothenticus]|uniref:Multidrug ABC transporter ATP-binding protein n=1 Tax=Virgibacillus pantothenticus TaxID=1473 RepID=A0A0L0QKS1_VIRPA|nr:ABC-F family ATP-binding cassette domain-containing protein [Virgibacillus pantothenticus]KNE19104.1 multidrug ABC transporter ATP-binding protein [Virgibacillus pantothenticus]MED3736163.1 ABC-F family ATP-binding cassette domain-containing protein [Virgibacillus pantothenticus]QTY15556.1 ABC-F family ATP-binding cassette domain-containing protein [Virgibacillus pantothenticus]SIT00040.1 ATP-binding cassette, subfamily F, uup [Virgibacillus pantothenticus]